MFLYFVCLFISLFLVSFRGYNIRSSLHLYIGFVFILACDLTSGMVGDGYLFCVHFVGCVHVPV